MNEPTCSNCYKRFSAFPSNSKPVELLCQDMVCNGCYKSLLRINGECLVCDKKVTKTETYCSLLPILEIEALSLMSIEFLNVIFDMIGSYFSSNIDDARLKLDLISSALINMEMLNPYGYIEKKAFQVRQFEAINSELTYMKELVCEEDVHIFVLKIESFVEERNVFDKIMDKLKRGKKLYIAANIGGIMKFGEVEDYRNYGIMVHSLTSDEIEDNASYIWIRQFKNYFQKMWSFFTFPGKEANVDNTLIFEIVESQKKSGYLELCTGEAGKSFQGSKYVKTGSQSLEINMAMNYMNLKCGQKDLKISSKTDETVMRFNSSTKWEIRTIKKGEVLSKSIVGRLHKLVDFKSLYPENSSDRKIKKCGLCVFDNSEYHVTNSDLNYKYISNGINNPFLSNLKD